jgi:hypothetical protein
MLALYIIYFLIGIIVALLVIALFLPSSYNIEKSTIIKKPVPEVMNRVADLNNYARWNPWQKKEPGSKMTIKGTPKTPGHSYGWNGKKIGEGNLVLRTIDQKYVHFDLTFIRPFKSEANDNWMFEEWGTGETKVTWQNDGDLPYPMGRLMGKILNKELNKQFEEGLKNLKQLCEGA